MTPQPASPGAAPCGPSASTARPRWRLHRHHWRHRCCCAACTSATTPPPPPLALHSALGARLFPVAQARSPLHAEGNTCILLQLPPVPTESVTGPGGPDPVMRRSRH